MPHIWLPWGTVCTERQDAHFCPCYLLVFRMSQSPSIPKGDQWVVVAVGIFRDSWVEIYLLCINPCSCIILTDAQRSHLYPVSALFGWRLSPGIFSVVLDTFLASYIRCSSLPCAFLSHVWNQPFLWEALVPYSATGRFFLVLWHWLSHLTSLSLNFLICKMGIMTSMLGRLMSINEYILAAIEMVCCVCQAFDLYAAQLHIDLVINFTVPVIQAGHQLAFSVEGHCSCIWDSVDHVISVRIHVSIIAPVHKAAVDHIWVSMTVF